MKNVTIHEVARQAEVSIATVSRVINNHHVEPKTAAKVNRAIRDTGYVPDAIARGMRRGKSFAIGYIVSDISNGHFTIAAKYLEETLGKEGYSLIVCSTRDDREREMKQLRLLASKKVDGLVINVSGANNDVIVKLSQRLPVVLLSRKIADPGFKGDFVGSDGFQGAYALGRHVLSMGHRHIGLIRGPQHLSTGVERYNGFVTALKESGISLPESMIHLGDHYEESGWVGAERLLGASQPPSILIAMNNPMALGALAYLRQQEVRVPEGVSFAAYGNISNRDLLYVPPTTISEKPEQEGKLAGEILLRRIADMDATPLHTSVPGELLIGNSIQRVGVSLF